jgi:phosphate transport system substrate-binding protein
MSIARLSTALLVVATIAASASAQVRITGSSSVGALLTKKQAEIEAKAGQKLQVIGKNAGIGLQDLCAGKTELAMIVGPLDKVVAAANAEQANSVDSRAIMAVEVGQEPVVFVVHPSNPVNSVTLAQLKDVLTGKITNWKALGGADAEIKVFALTPSNGSRLQVDQTVLGGAPLAKSAVVRPTSKDIAPMVAQVPAALAFVPKPNVGAGVAVLQTDAPIPMAIQIVAKGKPSAAHQQVIDAIRAALAPAAAPR